MDGNLASTDQVFQDTTRKTSAHYGVEDATVHQYVTDVDTAWHAGDWQTNLTTIGIEHSAQPGRDASDATYETSAQLIAAAAKHHGFPVNTSTVRPHRAIIATECPGTININLLIARANQLLGMEKNMMPNIIKSPEYVKAVSLAFRRHLPSQEEIDAYVGHEPYEKIIDNFNPELAANLQKDADTAALVAKLQAQLAAAPQAAQKIQQIKAIVG